MQVGQGFSCELNRGCVSADIGMFSCTRPRKHQPTSKRKKKKTLITDIDRKKCWLTSARKDDRSRSKNKTEKKSVTTLEKRFFFLSKILLFLIETTPGEADIYETSISNSNIFFSKPQKYIHLGKRKKRVKKAEKVIYVKRHAMKKRRKRIIIKTRRRRRNKQMQGFGCEKLIFI